MPKTNPQPKTLRDEVTDVVHAVGDVIRQGSANTFDAAAPRLRDASDKLEDVADQVRPQVNRFNSELRPRLEELGKQGASQFEQLSGEGRAQFDSARQRFNDEIAPQMTERAGGVASNAAGLLATAHAPKFVDDLATRVTGDKKALKKAQKSLAKASKDIAKNTAQKKSGNGGTTALIWILALGGLAGIAYFVWKKAQPVEDPWSTPLPNNRPADARPVGSTPASKATGTSPTVSSAPVPAAKIDSADDAAGDPDSADSAAGGSAAGASTAGGAASPLADVAAESAEERDSDAVKSSIEGDAPKH